MMSLSGQGAKKAAFFRGSKGRRPPVGKPQARNPIDKPEVRRDLLGKGDLGPAAGAIPIPYAHHVRQKTSPSVIVSLPRKNYTKRNHKELRRQGH